jgi:hypothetical protein
METSYGSYSRVWLSCNKIIFLQVENENMIPPNLLVCCAILNFKLLYTSGLTYNWFKLINIKLWEKIIHIYNIIYIKI